MVYISYIILSIEVTVIVNGRDYKSISWALDSYQHIFPNSSLKAIPFELPSHPESSEEGGSATALNALRATGRVKVRRDIYHIYALYFSQIC